MSKYDTALYVIKEPLCIEILFLNKTGLGDEKNSIEGNRKKVTDFLILIDLKFVKPNEISFGSILDELTTLKGKLISLFINILA